MNPPPLITAQTEEKLLAFLTESGHTKFRVQQIMDWVWRKRVASFDAMTNLSPALRSLLAENFRFHTPEIVEISGTPGSTRKFLTRMEDGSLVESVIIPAAVAEDGEKADRTTLCVSSQVGCAFGCKFCASGLLGLRRNLSAGEITGQILSAESIAGKRINNLVFMGMGEPLANFDNLHDALEIITSHRGLEIGARHITISTSGFVPGLKKLAAYPRQIRLAVSLHGATDEVRSQIMPVNKKMASFPAHPCSGGMGKGPEPDAHAGIHPHPGRKRLPERCIPSRADRQAPARQSQPHPVQHRGGASLGTPLGRALLHLPRRRPQGPHPRHHAV